MVRLNLPKPRLISIPANPIKRVVAFLIDLIVIDLILFFPFRKIFENTVPDMSFSSLNQAVSNPELTGLFVATAASMGIITILYFSMLEFRISQTIGKILLNINVISEGKEKTFWQFLARNILLVPITPFVVFWFADVIYIFFNHNRQRLLEVLSKTRTTETYIEVLR